MHEADAGEIVVGFSSSAASAAALRWAAAEGRRQRRGVRAVHVVDVSERADARLDGAVGRRDSEVLRRYAGRVAAVLDGTGAAVTVSVVDGPLLDRLVSASVDAALLVIGAAGECRHRGLDDELRRDVECPVVVVPAA